MKRFYHYMFGRKFTITTDHKPLLGLFGHQKSIPHMASLRLQRWCLTMSTYDYELCYRAAKSNGNADALSRLPLPDRPDSVPTLGEVVCMMKHMNNTTSTSAPRNYSCISRTFLYQFHTQKLGCVLYTRYKYFLI